MPETTEKTRPARSEIPVADFRVKIEPKGDRPFGYTAYDLTVSTPRWAYYEAEYAHCIWGKGLSDPRIVKHIRYLQARLDKRLAKPMFDGRLGDFTRV